MDTQIHIYLENPEPFANATTFGSIGPYELLTGYVNFAIDPLSPLNQSIVDLKHVPRTSSELVEYSSDLTILKPVDFNRGNRKLIYDANTFGNKYILKFINGASQSNKPQYKAHAGNAFLMRRGYSIMWCGWQGDILPGNDRMTMLLPTPELEENTPVTDMIRTEFIVDKPNILSMPLSGNSFTKSYETISLDTKIALFTRRKYESSQKESIPHNKWSFSKSNEKGLPIPSYTDCYIKDGFKPGWIYELVYTARNPLVMGLGFTAVRDLVSFLRNNKTDHQNTPNPFKAKSDGINKIYGWGQTEGARFLREFVYRGFNEDAKKQPIFDAIAPHASGAGRIALNYRFAQPGRCPLQHTDHTFPSDEFPFAYPFIVDPISGKADGILKRPVTDPLVIHTQTSSDYWERRGSLVHTDPLGNDIEDHKNSRIYLLSCTHSNETYNHNLLTSTYKHNINPINISPLLRALIDILDDWADNNITPPDSRIPTQDNATAEIANPITTRFPHIPNVVFPKTINLLKILNHGRDFDNGIISKHTPDEDTHKAYTLLIPKIDDDGNEISGIHTPYSQVPKATFTGWNFCTYDKEEQYLPAGLIGSFFPFAKTTHEREISGDSRPSIEERYHSNLNYIRCIAVAVNILLNERFLLEEDADVYLKEAINSNIS